MSRSLLNITPDATVFSSIILAYVLDRTSPIADVVPVPFQLVGWLIVIIGLGLMFNTISVIRRHNTSSNVTHVPPALMTKGFYAFSRNPFYVSYVLITLGAAIVLSSLSAFVAPVVCFLVLQLLVIPVEERKLQAAFGHTYTNYKRSVRRWL